MGALHDVKESVTHNRTFWDADHDREKVIKELQLYLESIYWSLPNTIPDEWFRAACEDGGNPWAA